MTRRAVLALFFLAPPLPAEPPCVEKKYCHTDVLLVPKEKATTVPDWKLREVEVGRVITGPALDFVEEKRCVTEMTLKPREVEQVVTVTESRPVTVTDPCTGKCRTEYKPFDVVKTVKVQVYDVVPVQREVVIRVPVLKPGPEAVHRRLQLDKTTAPAVERRFEAVTTPSVNKVMVPAPVVVPPCPVCR
jgi:hypothetical protein